MIGATAFFFFFITLVIGIIVGGGFTLTTTLIMKSKKRKDKMKLWLIGGGIGLIVWIVVLVFSDNSTPGGAPQAENYENMFKIFALAGLTPGILLAAGSISQLVGLIRGAKH